MALDPLSAIGNAAAGLFNFAGAGFSFGAAKRQGETDKAIAGQETKQAEILSKAQLEIAKLQQGNVRTILLYAGIIIGVIIIGWVIVTSLKE
jgi:hypothetical protein